MGAETIFRVMAVDKRKEKYSKTDIEALAKEELKHGIYCGENNEKLEEIFARDGIPEFIEVRGEQTEENKKYNMLAEQKEDPFPLWIETSTGRVAHEVFSAYFVSDFMELAHYFNLNGQGKNEMVVISKDEAKKMLQAINYVLEGDYNKKIERALFADNEYFRIFEEQFFFFSNRFRKRKEKIVPQQTIRIIIDDKRASVKQDEYVDAGDEYDYDAEMSEEENSDRYNAEHLRDILTTFLMLEPKYHYNEPTSIEYKLTYEYSY